jgi:hypothetical protein
MMALKEYIGNIEIKPTISNSSPFKVFLLNLMAVVINNIIPFACGVYFVQTKSLIFVLPMFFVIFFNVAVRSDKNG